MLSGWIPGYKKDGFKLLPSSISKKVNEYTNTNKIQCILTCYVIFVQQVWRLYSECCKVSGEKEAGYKTFMKYWTDLPTSKLASP